MLFKRALRRDFANLAGVIFSTLFSILVTTTLIRMLGRAAAGSADTSSVLPLIAFASINYLPVLLILTLYITVLMSLTRAYQDSEMVIWFASGQSVAAWIRPVLRFTVPFLIVIAVGGFLATPWANQQTERVKEEFADRQDVSQVSPGQFRESSNGNRVFFVESVSDDQKSVRNVFVTQTRGDNVLVVVSAGGVIQTEPDGDRFLVLEKGRRYDGSNTSKEFRIMEFDRYGVRIESKKAGAIDQSTKMMPTLDLMRSSDPRERAELLWRISLPISAVLLALVAIPMASANPRAGRSINLLLALLLYVTYSNLISLAQSWVAVSKASFWSGLLSVHLGMGLLIAYLFWRRMTLPQARWRWLPGGLRAKAAS